MNQSAFLLYRWRLLDADGKTIRFQLNSKLSKLISSQSIDINCTFDGTKAVRKSLFSLQPLGRDKLNSVLLIQPYLTKHCSFLSFFLFFFFLSICLCFLSVGNCQMSWDEYVKSCKEAVSQRQHQQQDVADPRTLPVELLQTFRLPGPCFDSVSLLTLNPDSHLRFNLAWLGRSPCYQR